MEDLFLIMTLLYYNKKWQIVGDKSNNNQKTNRYKNNRINLRFKNNHLGKIKFRYRNN